MTMTRARKRPNKQFIFPWKHFFKVILFGIFLATCFFVADKIRNTNCFPVHQVKVYGIHHADRKYIENSLLPLVNSGFFSVNVDLIKERLTQLPWVMNAHVQRVWPGQILITLEEREPLARWNHANLLSTKGEVFSPDVRSYPENLPDLFGEEGRQIQMMEYFQKINNLIAPLHFTISRLELTPAKTWILTLNNGVKLSANYKDVLTHIGHFVKVYPKVVGDRTAELEYVDLRYSNGMAIKWKS